MKTTILSKGLLRICLSTRRGATGTNLVQQVMVLQHCFNKHISQSPVSSTDRVLDIYNTIVNKKFANCVIHHARLFYDSRVCSVRYVPRRTAGINRLYYRYWALR